MELIDGLIRLVNEHASAEVLKAHLGFVKEKSAAQQVELTQAQQQLAAARCRITELEAEQAALQARLDRQQMEADHRQQQAAQVAPGAEALLRALAHNAELTTAEAALAAGLGTQIAIHHLHHLQQRRWVIDHHAAHGPVLWELAQGGRAYLIKRGLLE